MSDRERVVRPSLIAVTVAAAVTFGAIHFIGGERSDSLPTASEETKGEAREPSHVPEPAGPARSLGVPVEATQAAPGGGQECPRGYRLDADLCIPLHPRTGEPYSAQELAAFRAIVDSGRVARKNFLVPRVLSPNEAKDLTRDLQTFYRLGGLIQKGSADQDVIDGYYAFYERLINYKRQIVAIVFAEGGGRYPEMLDHFPHLAKHQRELDQESDEAYRQRVATYQHHHLDRNRSHPDP